ncbi:hypothetical protein C7399_14150, partial [Paraburkholderia tropica]
MVTPTLRAGYACRVFPFLEGHHATSDAG